MAKGPKEIFNPGELSRTRRNIGFISEEEAKKMSKILGGEIGIERSDESIDKKYKKLADQNRRKNDYFLRPEPKSHVSPRSWKKPASPDLETKGIIKVNQGYMDRVRMAFLAYKSLYRIKTFSSAVYSFFNFLPKYQNRVNPYFIKRMSFLVLDPLDRLTSAVRYMYSSVKNKEIMDPGNPYLLYIIKTILDWDIIGIEGEIKMLKSIYKEVTFDSCSNITGKIYVPLVILSKVDIERDIKPALEYVYKQGTSSLSPGHPDIVKLRKKYIAALEEIPKVFLGIKYNLLPLLLNYVCPRVFSYREMLKNCGKELLLYLGLKPSGIITRKSFEHYISPPSEAAEEDKTLKNAQPLDIGVTQGLYLLESLFPGSGWLKLKNNPDMFPSYKEPLELDSDFAIVPADDILQKVIILSSLLRELFYGFRAFDFRLGAGSHSEQDTVRDILENITDNWYHFLTTLIKKNYITTLTEYCRQLEHESSFGESDYGKRIEADLFWMRKKYIFPHLHMDIPKIMQSRIKLSIPELYKQVDILRDILERMVIEIWDKDEISVGSILNPDSQANFDIESTVSRRLRKFLTQKGKELDNKNLILSSLQITMVLDYLLNNENSPAYNSPPGYLYRSEGNLGRIPVYSVQSYGGKSGWDEKSVNKEIQKIDPDSETGEIDVLSGFPGSKVLESYINENIQDMKASSKPFTLVILETRDYHLEDLETERKVEIIKQLSSLINETIRQFEDIPIRGKGDKFYIILPDTGVEGSLRVIKRIFDGAGEDLPCFAGITECKDETTSLELIKAAEEALKASKLFPAPMVSYLNPETGEFDHSL